jgi:transcriptional regulator with XRE-family HTH domain
MKTHDDLIKEFTKNDPKKLLEIHIETLKLKILEGLVAIREQLQLTQEEAAKRIGMKQQVISRIENGENVTINTLLKYMDGLHRIHRIEHAKITRKNSVFQFLQEIETGIKN